MAKKTTDDMSFKEAFSFFRKKHGGDGGKFRWQGKVYTTDLKSSGKSKPKAKSPEVKSKDWGEYGRSMRDRGNRPITVEKLGTPSRSGRGDGRMESIVRKADAAITRAEAEESKPKKKSPRVYMGILAPRGLRTNNAGASNPPTQKNTKKYK